MGSPEASKDASAQHAGTSNGTSSITSESKPEETGGADTAQKQFLFMSGEAVWPSLVKRCHTIRDAREAIARDQTVSRGEEVRIKLMLDDQLLTDDQEISSLPGPVVHVAVEAVWNDDLRAKILDMFKYDAGDGCTDRRARSHVQESWPKIFGLEYCDVRNPQHTTRTQAGLLHFAAKLDRPKVVKDLLELKADVNLPDKSGRTPLDYALESRSTSCCRALITAGGKAQDSGFGSVGVWALEAFCFNPWILNLRFVIFVLMCLSAVGVLPFGNWVFGGSHTEWQENR